MLIKEGDTIEKGTKLTEDPNVGGFGQLDKEIVLAICLVDEAPKLQNYI